MDIMKAVEGDIITAMGCCIVWMTDRPLKMAEIVISSGIIMDCCIEITIDPPLMAHIIAFGTSMVSSIERVENPPKLMVVTSSTFCMVSNKKPPTKRKTWTTIEASVPNLPIPIMLVCNNINRWYTCNVMFFLTFCNHPHLFI